MKRLLRPQYQRDQLTPAGRGRLDGAIAERDRDLAVPFAGVERGGRAAQVLPDATGQLAWSSIWGNIIGFDLNTPVTAGTNPTEPTGQYDAVAHGITGFAFDLEGDVSRLRVAFRTQGTEDAPAYWAGATMDLSPVTGPGHYEIRRTDVAGPIYLASPPAFDPRKLEAIEFHVPSSDFETRP